MRYVLAGLPAALAIAAPALAADQPSVAPPSAWVESVTLPAPDPARAQAPIQLLLLNGQTRFGESGHEFFTETAALIQTPEGMNGMGTISLPWQPDLSDLTVHAVKIVRDGKTIDLLASGAKFTTLRRENNLEQAVLDGTLTAVLQPEGLSVGDTLLVSYTIRTKPSSLRLEPEQLLVLPPELPIRRVRYRQIWPEAKSVQWKAGPAMGTPKLRRTAAGNELLLELTDARAPKPPARAPGRYALPAYLQLSGYPDWASVSRTVAPLYTAAAAVPPSSGLQVEIERIAAAHRDPEERALAALRLVQDRIRYVALAMGEGGYTPASADQTWSRKFGDCKGKTVTLIALLRGLGIDAEPLLVHAGLGDSLGDRLPGMGLFNHVIVRATVAGKSYLLDGTRLGDRGLDAAHALPFGWGLPLRVGGAALEKLPLTAPTLPNTEVNTNYDASGGLTGPVPVKTEIVMRGDIASAYRNLSGQAGKEALKKAAEEAFEHDLDGIDIQRFDYRSDDAQNSFTLSFEGKATLAWVTAPGPGKTVRLRFNDDVISWDADFTREAGYGADAPFALSFPVYVTSRETVLLPGGGAGFRIDGQSFERELAGTVIRRRVTLSDGRAVAESSFRRLRNEISAAEAMAARAGIDLLGKEAAFVRAPDGYKPSRAELDRAVAFNPESSDVYLARGYELMQRSSNKAALADFRRAAELDPKSGLAHSNQAIALIHLGKLDEAEAELNKALALDAEDFVVHQGLGLLRAARDQQDGAVEAFTRSLALDPKNEFTLARRAGAYASMGRFELALADAEQWVAHQPDNPAGHMLKARLSVALGRKEQALAALEAMTKAAPDELQALAMRAEVLSQLGLSIEARQAYQAAVARAGDAKIVPDEKERRLLLAQLLSASDEINRALAELAPLLAKEPDSPVLLNERCWMRATAGVDLQKALADCNRALGSQPESNAALDSRGLVKLRLGQADAAIADFSAALRLVPDQAASYYGRGLARLRKGDRTGGEADLAKARRLVFDIDARYERYGLKPERAGDAVAAARQP